jgi:hypothetical protein
MSRTSKDSHGAVLAFVVLATVAFGAVFWPYFLGTWLAVQFGAAMDSGVRSAAGWALEILYLAAVPLLVAVHKGLDLSRRRFLDAFATGLGVTGSVVALAVVAAALT